MEGVKNMRISPTIRTVFGLLLIAGFIAAQTQPKGEAMRQYQPGDQMVYSINATLEGTNPNNGEKIIVPMTGTRTITILSKKYRSPKGVMLLQRKQVNEREIVFQGQTRKETATDILLLDYGKDGTERIHGVIEQDKPQWVQNANGYAVSSFARIYVGLTFDTGEIKMGDRTRSAKFTVKRKEKVTVPAGTYDAYVCEGTTYDSRAGNSEAVMWMVPNVGTVKSVFNGNQGGFKVQMTTELTKMKLQKTPVKPAQPKKAPAKPTTSKPKK